ncbi:MAG: YihY/virulence factor BrkB family protein [Flavobacteriales bacterium]|nr:YihY/virulence factor BrkB family protein [Flavobacteriales bacterium]
MMQKIKRYLLDLRPVKLVFRKLDRIYLPGFEGNSLLKVGKFFIKNAFDEDLNLRSSYLAFNFFLALFPAIIFFFTLIAYLPIDNMEDQILKQLELILPVTIFEVLQSTISDILNHQRSSLLSFGFFMAIFFSSNGFLSMIRAFNRYKKNKTNPFKDRIKSIILTLIVVFILIISVTVIVYTTLSLNWLVDKAPLDADFWSFIYQAFEFVTLIFLLYLIFSSLYFIGSTLTYRWKFFSPGSTLSAILSFIATETFAYYVNHFNSYNKLYGSIGTIISLMLLIYFNSMIILIGFDLNYSIYRATKEKISQDDLN